ncbi:MAG: type VI secretion system-associated protein TagF [bacterium]
MDHWQWAAYGKHPVANDYLSLGKGSPLFQIFSDWVKNGYQSLTLRKGSASPLYSWRFWIKGAKRDSLICGLVRDSSDKLGRPYPFLLMGLGSLPEWQDQWDLVPLACDRSWSQLEYMATKTSKDLKQLEDEIAKIKPPSPQWTEFLEERKGLMESVTISRGPGPSDCQDGPLREGISDNPVPDWYFKEFSHMAPDLSERTEAFFCFDGKLCPDHLTLVDVWHLFLKSHLPGLPNAVFIGGAADNLCAAVFRRPLLPADFIQLWSFHGGSGVSLEKEKN